MKKLSEKQIANLQEFKQNGGTHVYLRIRKHYDSWYVRLFHVNNLLADNMIPSYWYKGLGDCTQKQAEKDGAKSLSSMNF